MIKYTTFQLDNGMRVLLNPNPNSNLVTFNLLYNVGARDEHPDHTGFAHLFEHLMFEGTKEVKVFDKQLQLAGATHNAFTCNDYTNYYITLPAENIETAFWLESDRMQNLDINQEKLDVQKKVVIEEFNQRYINQPYGDIWSELRKLAYRKHPYQWQTIGKELSHIEKVTLDEVHDFYERFYHPGNAILGVSGNIAEATVLNLCRRYFEKIPARSKNANHYPEEPVQLEKRVKKIEKDVPSNVLIKAYKSFGKNNKYYHAAKMLSYMLSSGKSSRIKTELVNKQNKFISAGAYCSGELDPDLFIVSGTLQNQVTFDQAEESIDQLLSEIKNDSIVEKEKNKILNLIETDLYMDMLNSSTVALKLCFACLVDDFDLINSEAEKLRQVSHKDLQECAAILFNENHSCVIRYKGNQKQ